MRITPIMMNKDAMHSLNKTASLINKYNEQLLSGKKVTKPSDDPISMTGILNARRSLNAMEQYDKNISTVRAHLQTAEGALSQIADILSRVNELAIQGSNGTYDEESRFAISQEINELKDQIGLLANTKYGDYYLFGGVDTKNAPYDKTTGNWVADPKANKLIEIEVAEGIFMPINIDGEELFNGNGLGRNVFDLLDNISENLLNGDSNELNNRIGELNDMTNQILKSTSTIGSTVNRLDLIETKNNDFILNAKEDLSNKEEVDVQELYIQLKSTQAVYQAGIAVTGKILQVSLIDYLR